MTGFYKGLGFALGAKAKRGYFAGFRGKKRGNRGEGG